MPLPEHMMVTWAAKALSRRAFLAGATALGLSGCEALPTLARAPAPPLPTSDQALLDDLQQRTFQFFWDTSNPANGLVPDRFPARPRLASIASVGFALTAYVAGVDAGLVSRAAARERVLATARFFATAPQGPQASGTAGHRGFFYHFLDMASGHRFDPGVELSSIDTALLLAGLLCAQAYFDRDEAGEQEIRRLVDLIYGRVDWPWMQQRGELICMGWDPVRGFKDFIDYKGFDEAMLMVLLALGSPTHAVGPGAWRDFTATYDRTWGRYMGQEHLGGAPLFWHQYSHVWVDFRGLQDAYMRGKGLDYFENSRRATLAQQAYAVRNPMGWNDYGAHVWGLTACDGPGMIQGPDHQGRQRQYWDYRARGAGLRDTADDGTIAPTAALSSLPFAPEIVLPTLRALRERFGHVIYGRYGFVDAFNTSFRVSHAQLSDGRYLDGFGWVDDDVIGIDQGPIVAMIANHRNGVIWQTMQRQPALRRGLARAGFAGGWLG
jgi:hypothetical protein